jgi:ribokinase
MSDIALYTIGNFTIDDIVLWPGGQTWMNQAGGNVLFSALGARIWLDRVGILARLGNDYPQERLGEIEARGICLGLHPVDVPTLHDWALYEANGGRQFINHLNSGSNEAMTLNADEIPSEHLKGRAYHLAPVPVHQQAALAAKLKKAGRIISLDPHEAWIRGNEAAIQAMLADVDFFLPSKVEARWLYGGETLEAAAREFARYGPKVVVIKLGTEGSLVYDAAQGRLTHVPVYPAQVRDTTGAGDAYCGGFLAGYLLNSDPVIAALYGTVSASYVIEAIGALATQQPALAEAQARLVFLAEKTGLTVKV